MPRQFKRLAHAIGLFGCLVVAGCGDSAVKLEKQERLIEEGLLALQYYDYNLAETKLSEVQSKLPESSERWVEVTFATAVAAWHSSPPSASSTEHAKALFEEIVERANDPSVIALAKLNLARIAEVSDYLNDPVDISRAQQLYQEVMAMDPGGEYGSEATLRLAQTYVQSLTHEGVQEAIQTLEKYLNDYPNSKWRNVVAQYLGDLYIERLNDPAKALSNYQIALESGFANATREHIYVWRMAQLAKQSGDELLGAEYCQKLIREYPRSQFGWFAANQIREYNETHPDAPVELPDLQNAFKVGVAQ